jgi:hypothetical protein
VRVYDRALSGSEIQRISDFGGTNPPPFVPDPPVIHTTNADQITPTSARIVGTIDNRGEALPYRVEYGKTTAYGQSSDTATAAAATGARPVALTISGLDPATEYHARLVSASTERAAVGEDITFHTGGLPRLRFTEPKVSAPEAGGRKQLTVELVGTATQPVTVEYLTSDGTATAGADYTDTAGDVTFAAGERFKTISIPVTDDGKDEPDETVVVSLANPSANAELGEHRAELTIADDDQAPKTTITANPDNPAGSDQAIVSVVGVGRTSTGAPIETRCVVNPATTPNGFDDLPAACPLLRSETAFTTPGEFRIYAASRDAAGNTEALVTHRVVILDKPDTTITDGPEGYLASPTARFTFSSSVPDSTFQCSIDGSPFTVCWAPHAVNGLAVGTHRFEVRAIGPAGGIDPTPAQRTFKVTVSATSIERADCAVNPVRHWLFFEINEARNGFRTDGMWACHIGPPRAGGCPAESVCTTKQQHCPRGARCTITTRGVWSDNDPGAMQGIRVWASTRLPAGEGALIGYQVPLSAPQQDDACYTDDRKGTGTRCTATARLVTLGDGGPIWGTCHWEPWYFGGLAGASFGYADERRIDCSTTVRIDPATPLDAIVNNSNVTVFAPSAGDLVATWGVKPAKAKASATAVSAAKPAIATTRMSAAEDGPVELKPKLNAAARRLLARTGRLAVKVRVVFTPAGGGTTVTRDQVAILRRVVRQPRACLPRAPKSTPKKRPRLKRCR